MGKVRILVTALFVTLGLALPVAAASASNTAPAFAHHLASAPPLGSGPFYIIPTVSNSGDPLTNHGVGNQASLTTSGTKWCPVAATQGYKLHQCSDMSHVLEKDGNGLYTQNLMAGNDQQEFFAANGNGRWTFQSVHTANTYIGVFNPDTGPAWVESQMTGFDTGWQLSATATTTAVHHGVIKLHTHSRRAGSCSLYVDWSATYGSQNTGTESQVWVKSYIDECSGGGTLRYRAEMVCDTDGGSRFYYYASAWRDGVGQGSTINQGNNCWEAVGSVNGAPVIAAMQENMNNPTRVDCRNPLNFTNGRHVTGSNCGVTT
jgi:hypothetical protein